MLIKSIRQGNLFRLIFSDRTDSFCPRNTRKTRKKGGTWLAVWFQRENWKTFNSRAHSISSIVTSASFIKHFDAPQRWKRVLREANGAWRNWLNAVANNQEHLARIRRPSVRTVEGWGDKERFFAVLEISPVKSAADAVRALIVADAKGKK